jgi:hypothetical protein
VLHRFLKVAIPGLLACAAVGAGELAFRWAKPERYPMYQRCLGFDENLHNAYAPGCRSLTWRRNEPVKYRYDEHGLRIPPRPKSPGSSTVVAVLGDSVVSGIHLPYRYTIPARFAALAGPGTRFLNAGVQFSSPITESLLMRKAVLPDFRLKGVVWFLNGSDVNDERLFLKLARTFDDQGVPTSFFPPGRLIPLLHLPKVLTKLNHGVLFSVDYFARQLSLSLMRRLVDSVPIDRRSLCGGIFRLAGDLKASRVPLLVVFTPHLPWGSIESWAGEPLHPEGVEILKECARETGARVLDLSAEKIDPEWYFMDGVHFDEDGTTWVAKKVLPELRAFLGTPRPAKRRGSPAG